MNSKGKVVVALSGGIDSSACAYILQQKGYEVVGITAKMVNDENFEEVAANAKAVADKLGIEHITLDLSEAFKENVIDYFEKSYECASTPNPCIVCNKLIKWGKILDYALNITKADYMATGHYAKIVKEDDKYLLYPALDEKKDQLYYLFELTQEQLSKTKFPLAGLTKDQVRTIAFENNLPSKSAKESQDICFIKKPMTTKQYILEHIEPKEGDIIHITTGEKLGTHEGAFQYTIGQRKGIGVSYSEPLYVVKIDCDTNTIYLGSEKDVLQDKFLVENINWHDTKYQLPFEAMVKIRYNMQAKKALIVQKEDKIEVLYYEPVIATAKGQAAVIYDFRDGHLIAGGWIV